MKRVLVALGLMLFMAAPAFAVDFTFHGDLNHEFRLLTNHTGFANGDFSRVQTEHQNKISNDDSNDTFALVKYRLWTTMASDDDAVKGVFAIELGGIHFGDAGTKTNNGGAFSGDGKNIEIRWAYTDIALAGGRVKVGLQPFSINKFLWTETATGVDYKKGNFEAAWMRGYEVKNTEGNNDFKDMDSLYARYNLKPTADIKVGFFGMWLTSNAGTTADGVGAPTTNYAKDWKNIDLNLYTVGVDGGMTAGNLFANWDLMYQFGDYAEDYDFGGYLAHFDLGMKMGQGKLTYTFWYASGDDNRNDTNLDAFVAVDVDCSASYSSIVLFESITDDNFFSTVPYIQDKGFVMNRIGYDYKVTDKLAINLAAMYMMTAEDIEYNQYDSNGDGVLDKYKDSNDSIGFEFDAGVSYKLYKSLTLSAQVGYLMADDALDFYEVDCDGNSDEDIYVVNSGIRYKF